MSRAAHAVTGKEGLAYLHHGNPSRVVVGDQVVIGINVAHIEHLDIREAKLPAHLQMRRHVVELPKEGSKSNVTLVIETGLAEDQDAILFFASAIPVLQW